MGGTRCQRNPDFGHRTRADTVADFAERSGLASAARSVGSPSDWFNATAAMTSARSVVVGSLLDSSNINVAISYLPPGLSAGAISRKRWPRQKPNSTRVSSASISSTGTRCRCRPADPLEALLKCCRCADGLAQFVYPGSLPASQRSDVGIGIGCWCSRLHREPRRGPVAHLASRIIRRAAVSMPTRPAGRYGNDAERRLLRAAWYPVHEHNDGRHKPHAQSVQAPRHRRWHARS